MIPYSRMSRKLPCQKKPSRNSSREPNTSKTQQIFDSLNTDICIIFNSVWGSIISKMTRCYDRRSGVQILAGERELSFFQNIQTSSSSQPASNYSFFSSSKLASADSLTTHMFLVPSFKISGAIPPLNLSPSMAHSGTTSSNPNHLPIYIYVKKSHPFWFYKGTFTQILLLTCTLRDPLIHFHWSKYINIMKRFFTELRCRKLWPGISEMKHWDMTFTSILMCLETRKIHINCNAQCDYNYTRSSAKQEVTLQLL